jgi:hypothetical protein
LQQLTDEFAPARLQRGQRQLGGARRGR